MNAPLLAIPKRPGGEIARRPLDYIWICDTSGSMAGTRIAALNHAVMSALPLMLKGAAAFPQSHVFVRTIAFDDDARWVVAERTPLERFEWTSLEAKRGLTAMGAAFKLAASGIKPPQLPEPHLPPVLILVTDGHPTDIPGSPTFVEGLLEITQASSSTHAQRFAVAVGNGTNIDKLRLFIDNPRIPPFEAKTVGDLFYFINWVSSAPISTASRPRLADDAAPFIELPERAPVQLAAGRRPALWDENEML